MLHKTDKISAVKHFANGSVNTEHEIKHSHSY